MHFKLLNPSKYLGAADFEAPDWKHGKEPTLTIRKVVLEQMEGEPPKGPDGKPLQGPDGKPLPAPTEMKGMITVDESPKGWLMNVTNARCLATMFGNETNTWIGKRVALHTEQVMSFGEWVPGVRIHGSPDLVADIALTIKMRKKKTVTLTLKKTGTSSANGKSAPTPFVPDGTLKFKIGKLQGTQLAVLARAELEEAISFGRDWLAKVKPGANGIPATLGHVAEIEAEQARRAKLEEQMASGAPPPGATSPAEPGSDDAPF